MHWGSIKSGEFETRPGGHWEQSGKNLRIIALQTEANMANVENHHRFYVFIIKSLCGK